MPRCKALFQFVIWTALSAIFFLAGDNIPHEGKQMEPPKYNHGLRLDFLPKLDGTHLHYLLGIFGMVPLVAIYLVVMHLLSRAPWRKVAAQSPEQLSSLCERCGTSENLSTSMSRSGYLFCKGCASYNALFFKSGLMILLPPCAFMSWYYPTLITAKYLMFLGYGMAIVSLVVAMIRCLFSCNLFRVEVGSNAGGFQQLQGELDQVSSEALSGVSDRHKESLREHLLPDEVVVWSYQVPFAAMLNCNTKAKMVVVDGFLFPMVWMAVAYIILVWLYTAQAAIVVGFLMAVYTAVFLLPQLISLVQKFQSVYVLTNYRAMRLNREILGNILVTSFPYSQMENLMVSTLPSNSEAKVVIHEGKVSWHNTSLNDEHFSCFEYVNNVEQVEDIIGTYRHFSAPGDYNNPLLERFATIGYFFRFLPFATLFGAWALSVGLGLLPIYVVFYTFPIAVWLTICFQITYSACLRQTQYKTSIRSLAPISTCSA